jgi:hypothetical protein
VVDRKSDESSVAFFIVVVNTETAESTSSVVFMEILREMLFSTVCENLFQFFLPGMRVE